MELDIPFVIIESAPRKRGKTTFNLALLPTIEHKFDAIHIFCPSIKYKDEYYEQFHKNPKYHLYSDNLYVELEKVVAKQQVAVKRAALVRRNEQRKQEKETRKRKFVQFQPAQVNGRKRKRKAEIPMRGNELIVEYPENLEKFNFLIPDIFAGSASKLTLQQLPQHSGKNKAKGDDSDVVANRLGPQILIILDDCIGEGLFETGGLARDVASRGRHYNASLIASAQQLTCVDIVVRNNADYFLFWRPHSVQELESFIEKFVSQNHRRLVRDIAMNSYEGEHEFIFYDPHAMQWSDRFVVGDKDAFFKQKMRKVFSDKIKDMFYHAVTLPTAVKM